MLDYSILSNHGTVTFLSRDFPKSSSLQNIALNLYPGNLKLSERKCTLTGILCLQITVGGGRRG